MDQSFQTVFIQFKFMAQFESGSFKHGDDEATVCLLRSFNEHDVMGCWISV